MSLVHSNRILYSAIDSWWEMTLNNLSFWRIWPRSVPENVSLTGLTYIVTGGNRGFGKGVTFELVSRGASVIIACRDIAKAQETINEAKEKFPGSNVTVCELDLASFDSIRKFASKINSEDEVRIDGLINNAALWMYERKLTKDNLETTFQVNYLGLVLLTHLLMDKLQQSKNGIIINVSSLAHHNGSVDDYEESLKPDKPFNFINNYSATKLALMLYTRQLAKQCANTNVHVYAVDPGISQTELGSNFPDFLNNFLNSWIMRPIMRDPIDGSRSIMFPVTFPRDEYSHDKYYFGDGKAKVPAKHAMDSEEERKLWKLTHQLLNVPEPKFRL